MGSDLTSLTGKFTSKVALWAKESYLRVFVVLFIIYVLIFPLAEYLQGIIKRIPYLYLLTIISNFVYKELSIKDLLFLLFFLLFLLGFLRLRSKLSENVKIMEEFKYELTNWSIPLYAKWVRQKCKDFWGNMLRIESSLFPGTLKGAYSWYDYEMSFFVKGEEKKDSSEFGFAVRVEDSSNAVIFQVTNNKVIPYLLYNGTFIHDIDNEEELPMVLDEDEWVKVKAIVKGNLVEINIGGNKIIYKIPSESYNVDNILLSGFRNPTLREIRRKDQERSDKLNQLIQRSDKIDSMQEGPEKENAHRQWSIDINNLPATTRITLDYQKGSIGLRTELKQIAYYRKLTVKKI